MSTGTREQRFNASAAKVVAAYADREADRLRYERAWTEFYEGFLKQVIAEGKVYANARECGYEADDMRIDLAMRVMDRIASGEELNIRVVYGIRRNALGALKAEVVKLKDQAVMERAVDRMRDFADNDRADAAAMRADLERFTASLGDGKRSQLKVAVMRTLLDEDVSSLADVARHLGRSPEGIRSTFFYLLRKLREQHPELAEHLDLPPAASDAELLETAPDRRH